MKVSQAKEIARQWVMRRITELPNVTHAFFHGSIMTRDDNADSPATSDVDIRIVVEQEVPPMFITLTGEFAHKYHLVQDVILDVIYMSLDQFTRLSSNILGEIIAVSFRRPNAIYDPEGQLDKIHRKVVNHYQDEEWVRQRFRKAQEIAHSWFNQAVNSKLSIHGWPSKRIENISWLYMGATPAVSQIPCVANLRGITLHTCLVKSQHTLSQYGYDDAYHNILEILGLDKVTYAEVEEYLQDLLAVLKYARSIHKTRYYGDHNLHKTHEPIVIDGSRHLIQTGLHREAMFNIVGMRNWIQNAIENDGGEPEKTRFRIAYDQMLASLGIMHDQDISARTSELRQYIPTLMTVANSIIERNPDIIRKS